MIADILRRAREHCQIDDLVLAKSSDPEDFEDLDTPEGRCVLAAIRDYSLERPYVDAMEITGEGPTFVLASWGNGYREKDVLYATDEGSHAYFDKNTWKVFQDPITRAYKLKFVKVIPTTPCYLVYSRPHEEDPTLPTTITPLEEEAVSMLAASKMLKVAQSYFARKSESATISADQVNYGSLSSRYKQAADDAMKFYKDFIAKTDMPQDTTGFVTWEGVSGLDRAGWIFHGRYGMPTFLGGYRAI